MNQIRIEMRTADPELLFAMKFEAGRRSDIAVEPACAYSHAAEPDFVVEIDWTLKPARLLGGAVE